MSKIKRIIEIEEREYETICEVANDTESRLGIIPLASFVIVHSKPYDDSGDLISREALKKEFGYTDEWYKGRSVCGIIDNAPTVEAYPFEQVQELVVKLNQQFEQEIENLKRPQGECITCKHRDPEDKKCDCGALERAGCPFPVSDDYFCKHYEKGGKEE